MSAPPTHADYQLSQLDQLEAESIHIFREVAAEFEKPVLMFSGGKDSIVMLRLAEKAFYPAKIPFPLLQVDTGLDFPEVLETRDNWVNRLGVRLVVASVEEAIAEGIVIDDGKTSRNRMQTATLLHAIEENGFTAAFGGGRRDEEKARAKERVYSHRDDFGQWDPKKPASRAVEPLQRQHPRRRAHAHLPAVQLDRARHLALPRPGGRRDPLDLLRPPAPRVQARRHVDDREQLSTPASRARRSSRRRCASAPSAT